MCVYIYICIYKFEPGVDSGYQPLSANKEKRKMSTAHLLITKPRAHSPIHELPYKKKKKTILFKRENKDAALPPFNSTTPLLLFSL